MKQFQVPQFIDVEDKILGPITMRQFFIMLIPFGTGILLFFLLKLWVVVIIVIPITIVCAIFAFYKPYGMKFSRVFSSFLTYALKPHMYIWKREDKSEEIFISTTQRKIESKTTQKITPEGGLKTKRSSIEVGSNYKEN